MYFILLSFDPYFLNVLGNKPFVLTVHDMMPELFPQYYSTNDGQIINKRLLSQKASHIITVSEQTKRLDSYPSYTR